MLQPFLCFPKVMWSFLERCDAKLNNDSLLFQLKKTAGIFLTNHSMFFLGPSCARLFGSSWNGESRYSEILAWRYFGCRGETTACPRRKNLLISVFIYQFINLSNSINCYVSIYYFHYNPDCGTSGGLAKRKRSFELLMTTTVWFHCIIGI